MSTILRFIDAAMMDIPSSGGGNMAKSSFHNEPKRSRGSCAFFTKPLCARVAQRSQLAIKLLVLKADSRVSRIKKTPHPPPAAVPLPLFASQARQGKAFGPLTSLPLEGKGDRLRWMRCSHSRGPVSIHTEQKGQNVTR